MTPAVLLTAASTTQRYFEHNPEKDFQVQPSASVAIRWTGLAALLAGITFAAIQPIHPADTLSSVTTNAWVIIQSVKTVMSFLFLVGIVGLYARQIEKIGWPGHVGFAMLALCWALQMCFIFGNALVLPIVADTAPEFVISYVGTSSGVPGEMNIGALVPIYAVVAGLYMLGGLLFGIGTLRAGILPRWPAILLAVASALTPLAALLPHATQRFAAIPVGLALAWLGYALWSERRGTVLASTGSGQAIPALRHVAAK